MTPRCVASTGAGAVSGPVVLVCLLALAALASSQPLSSELSTCQGLCPNFPANLASGICGSKCNPDGCCISFWKSGADGTMGYCFSASNASSSCPPPPQVPNAHDLTPCRSCSMFPPQATQGLCVPNYCENGTLYTVFVADLGMSLSPGGCSPGAC